jgi:Cys-tRNA(Pro)/Cys-tRNA(Cys) deacylase
MMEKTNAMRLLESHGINYSLQSYEVDEENLSAKAAAAKAGLDLDRVFKTLVLRSSSGDIFVCVIPGSCELDLKKAAQVSGSKKADLVPVKEIKQLTGYIRGGCSPIGMKRHYPTFIDESCTLYEAIYVSAGTRGLQVNIAPRDLIHITSSDVADLV